MMTLRTDNLRRIVEDGFRKGLIRPTLKFWQAETRALVANCVERGLAKYSGPDPVYREDDAVAAKRRESQRACMARLRANRKTEKETTQSK